MDAAGPLWTTQGAGSASPLVDPCAKLSPATLELGFSPRTSSAAGPYRLGLAQRETPSGASPSLHGVAVQPLDSRALDSRAPLCSSTLGKQGSGTVRGHRRRGLTEQRFLVCMELGELRRPASGSENRSPGDADAAQLVRGPGFQPSKQRTPAKWNQFDLNNAPPLRQASENAPGMQRGLRVWTEL